MQQNRLGPSLTIKYTTESSSHLEDRTTRTFTACPRTTTPPLIALFNLSHPTDHHPQRKMASMIFGAVYLGHHAIVGHRREKQRVKNYERWEGLRDEYDEQKRTQRESRSLDIQRTGQYDGGYEDDKPILTLRDQQEADDARTSWRPQESFTPMHTGAVSQQTGQSSWQPGHSKRPQSMDVGATRAVSDQHGYSQHNANGLGIQDTGYQSSMRALPAQKTGLWDEGLPQPIRVSRQNFDDGSPHSGPTTPPVGVNRSSSLREYGNRGPPQQLLGTPRTPYAGTPRTPYAGSSESLNVPKRNTSNASRSPSIREERMAVQDVEPVEHDVPGGRMAELLEGSGRPAPTATRPMAPAYMPSAPVQPAPMPSAAPTSAYQTTSLPSRQGDMQEWWKQQGAAPAAEKDMQEWWRQ